jgi:hypothetical protein
MDNLKKGQKFLDCIFVHCGQSRSPWKKILATHFGQSRSPWTKIIAIQGKIIDKKIEKIDKIWTVQDKNGQSRKNRQKMDSFDCPKDNKMDCPDVHGQKNAKMDKLSRNGQFMDSSLNKTAQNPR